MMFELALLLPLAVIAFLMGVIAWVAWQLWRVGQPENCIECGKTLEPEEQRFYGNTCEACESAFWANGVVSRAPHPRLVLREPYDLGSPDMPWGTIKGPQ